MQQDFYIPIAPDGKLCSITKEISSFAHVDAIYSIVKDIKLLCGDELCSVILRGSVAYGRFLPGISDLDMVIFLQKHNQETSNRLEALAVKEAEKWKTLFPTIDLSCANFDTLLTELCFNRLYLNLKLTGLTLWGDDLISLLPDAYCNRRMATRIARQTLADCLSTQKRIQEKQSVLYMGLARGCSFLCVWFLRDFCRGLIAPVMTQRQVFSLSVQTCCKEFLKSFPEYRSFITRCCLLEREPTNSWEELLVIAAHCIKLYQDVCIRLGLCLTEE